MSNSPKNAEKGSVTFWTFFLGFRSVTDRKNNFFNEKYVCTKHDLDTILMSNSPKMKNCCIAF